MAHIDKIIEDLQSESIEIRYNACKQLGNEQSLPEEAIEALHMAVSDPEPLIAAAANKALGNYEHDITSVPLNGYSRSAKYNDFQQSSGIDWEKFFLIGSSALFAFLATIGMFNLSMSDVSFYSEDLDSVLTFAPIISIIYFCGLIIFSSLLASIITGSIMSFWGHRMNTKLSVFLSFLIGAFSGIILYIISFFLFWN